MQWLVHLSSDFYIKSYGILFRDTQKIQKIVKYANNEKRLYCLIINGISHRTNK